MMERKKKMTEAVRSRPTRPAWRHLVSLALLVVVSVGASGCIVVPFGYWGHGGHHHSRHRDWR